MPYKDVAMSREAGSRERPGAEAGERLRWQCRRGMLELDLLLESFLERDYPSLSDQEKRDFTRLLEMQDPQLHDWIMGDKSPDDPAFSPLILALRETLGQP